MPSTEGSESCFDLMTGGELLRRGYPALAVASRGAAFADDTLFLAGVSISRVFAALAGGRLADFGSFVRTSSTAVFAVPSN